MQIRYMIISTMLKYINNPAQVLLAPVLPTIIFCMIMYYGISLRIPINAQDKLLIIIYGITLLNAMRDVLSSITMEIVIGKSRGNITTLLIAPVSPLDMLIGYSVTRSIRILIVSAILIILVQVLMAGKIYIANIVMLLFYLFLGSVFMTSLSLILGCLSSTYERMYTIETIIVVPIVALSGTFFTLNDITNATLKTVVCMNPMFNILSGARGSVMGTVMPNVFWIFYTMCITVAMCFLACQILRVYREKMLPF